MAIDLTGKRILVTGAGGWLGGVMAAWLAEYGASITALLRRPGPVLDNDGVPARLQATVMGDITQGRFGLDRAEWHRLAGRHDLILHCAALTRFDADPALARAVNVGGTAEVVALAKAGGAGLLHVSTAYVNGTREGVVLEAEPIAGSFNNIYEQTKAEAEALVRGADIRAVIARPSIVLGNVRAGHARVMGGLYYLFKLMAEGRIPQMPAEPGVRLNLIPIDEVAFGLLFLLDKFEQASGRVFHVVSDLPTPLSAFQSTLSAFPGLSVPEFVPPRLYRAPANRFHARLVELYAPYFRRSTDFNDDQFLSLTGSACVTTDEDWWERLVTSALEAGFIQASRTRPNGSASERTTPNSAGSR